MMDSDSDTDESTNYENEDEQDTGHHVDSKGNKISEEQYKAAVNAIKTKINDGEIDVDKFLSEHGAVAGQYSDLASENLLHAIVGMIKRDGMKPENVECLIQRLVEVYPNLLEHKNKYGYNPVHLAIGDSAHQLAEYMISACIESENSGAKTASAKQSLDIALLQTAQDGKTCLHAAFLGEFNLSTARTLLENASDKALAAQDDNKNTPMHYAASFKQCTAAGADIIDLFIARDLDATRQKTSSETTFLDLSNAEGRSVYEELQFSKQTNVERYRAKRKERGSHQMPDQSVSATRPAGNIPPKDPKEDDELQAGTRDASPSRDPRGKESKLDNHEKERQRKKEEELTRLKAGAEAFERKSRVDRVKGQETTGRDASSSSQSQTNDTENQSRTVPAPSNVRRSPTKPMESSANMSIKRRGTGQLDVKLEQGSLATEAPHSTSKLNVTADRSVKRRICKEILLKLKLHYMRTRSSEMALSFLYGANMNDIQISFDYDRLPAKVVWNEFVKQFGADNKSGFKFDRVLQYVTFPRVEVTAKGRQADREREAENRQQEYLGRKDMMFFFDWLYEKGVRHIIRVSVNDSGDLGEKVHTDQSIQKCLERFVVESLYWQKTDLDPETILRVSARSLEKVVSTNENPKHVELLPDRQLRELWLRWSGSNAVLRAWSEPEGLPMLSRLERVHLLTPAASKMYDDPHWIKQKFEEFRMRLNKNFRDAQDKRLKLGEEDTFRATGEVKVSLKAVDVDGDSKLTARGVSDFTSSTPVKGINSHRWLGSTSRFAGNMKYFWDTTLKQWTNSPNKLMRSERGVEGDVEDDVVVALIDDGVDRLDKTLSGQVLEGKSFDYHDGQVRPPFSSARGHGTVMASMILRVCPMAKIYPIRLRTYDTIGGKSQIDRKYAAQAIKAALAKNATIISMSWTLPKSSLESETEDELHEILKVAVRKKVLMFCSSPDEGKFTELDYPSGPWRDHFFRIGAARADGTVFEWTPDDGISFVLPGVDIVKEQAWRTSSETQSLGVTSRVTDFKYETGSSVATALAAGLAAMIIYCVKASIMAIRIAYPNPELVIGIAITNDHLSRISKHDAMKQAFSTLGKVTPNRFIQVWEKLDAISGVLEAAQSMKLTEEEQKKLTQSFVDFGSMLLNGQQVGGKGSDT